VLFLALTLAGCGESAGSDQDSDANAQPAGKPTVHELYREFVVALNDRNAEGACALFTEDGMAAFAEAWDAPTCDGAVDRAAAEFGDMRNLVEQTADEEIEEQNGIAEFGADGCRPGRLSAKKTETGWLFFDYSFHTMASCGG
jgi:hypothetical protein